jgi:putative PEP-CTERM system TPR-repeat lipoprotein
MRLPPVAASSLLCLALLAAGCAKPDPQQYVRRGDQYVAQGRFAEAVIEYRNAIQRDSSLGTAYFKLGDAYMQLKDIEYAAVSYVRAAQLLPDSIDAQVRAGDMLLLGKKFKEAQACARRALILDYRNVRAQVINANALAGLKRHDLAMAAIERVIAMDPTRADAYNDLGALQLEGATPDKAEAAFKRAVTLNPRSIDAHLTLASFYWVQGRLSDAEILLNQAFAVEPKSLIVNRALATFYLSTNRGRQAEQHLLVAVEAIGTTAARLMLADYYLSMGRREDASAALVLVASRKDGFGAARSRQAVIAYQAGQRDTAYRLLDEALAADPSNARALLARAGMQLDEGRLDEALRLAQSAMVAEPSSLSARYLLATVYERRQDTQAAERQYLDILKISPQSTAAQLELARLNLSRGATKAAEDAALVAIKGSPRSADAQMMMLRALISSGDVARADVLMRPLLAETGGRADVQWLAGTLQLMKHNRERAREHFERALQLQPDALEPLDALIALDLASGNNARARARVDAQLKARPRSTALLLLAGRAYSAVGDHDAASKALRTAIEIDPNDPAPYDQLVRVYAVQGTLDRATRELEALGAQHRGAVGPPTMLGTIMLARNRPTEAQVWFEKALEVNPRAVVAANNLAWLYAEEGGDLSVALRLALLAKEQLPMRPEVNDTLGWVYFKLDDLTHAIPTLKASVAAAPDNPLFSYHLGLAYAKAGQKELARTALQTAVRSKVPFTGVANARSVLASLR